MNTLFERKKCKRIAKPRVVFLQTAKVLVFICLFFFWLISWCDPSLSSKSNQKIKFFIYLFIYSSFDSDHSPGKFASHILR